jgi:5-methylcytosine-specific restriction protein A
MAVKGETRKQADAKMMSLALRVQDDMRRRYGGASHLTFCDPRQIGDSDGDGPNIDIAHFRKPEFWIELDYSDFWGGNYRRVWFGLFAASKRILREQWIAAVIKHPIQKRKQDTKASGEYRHFNPPLADGQFEKTVVEAYSTWGEFYVGCYSRRQIADKSLVNDISGWIGKWLPKLVQTTEEAVYEEWRSHYEGERVNRNSTAASEAKRKAHYQCEVCELRFSDKYGAELGDGFLEAHHLVPVVQKKATKWPTSADSLVALCSNCHEMLHRLLRGKPVKNIKQGHARVKQLRKIVRQHRGVQSK